MSAKKQLVYTGTADHRHFSKADFERVGVEADGIKFENGVPVDDASDSLIAAFDKGGPLASEFVKVVEVEEKKADTKTETKTNDKKS